MLTGPRRPTSLAVITSGGDAAGMNPAVRSVVRSGIAAGLEVYTIREGFKGMVKGGDAIKRATSRDVGGILHQGGTVLGTARSDEFRTREGRLTAARNLAERDIDALIVIGGDGSLTGASIFRDEWPGLLEELVQRGDLSKRQADAHPRLTLVGLVGSIDNDMFGTDMTIGADTALHRITEAIDAILSTASSHQRSFVIEVMGRNCGYLALMAGLATGANWVVIPENPPEGDWETVMCEVITAGREMGRRQNVVIVAEGARDLNGNPITANHLKEVLEERLGEDTRMTILGHVQRGGAPSAFDRYLSTVLGYAAIEQITKAPGTEPQLIGIREHQIISSSLNDSVDKTRRIAEVIAEHDSETAMDMRGGSFTESYRVLRTLVRAQTDRPPADGRRLRLAILHAGGPAPGMNTAARVAVRMGIDQGHTMLGVTNGFRGLLEGRVQEMNWRTVSGWVGRGGAELGISRLAPSTKHMERLAEQVAEHRIDGILMFGGWAGYQGTAAIHAAREQYPVLGLPIVCVPTSINNDLPGTEMSIGADTALNNIVSDVDKIKQSAVAYGRCFVVEVMGRHCGYLALMSGLATGAERVYLPEEGISLRDLENDLTSLREGFSAGKRLGLVIRSENVDPIYTTQFIGALYERESEGLFDVRSAVLGHIQQGGDPSPYDRIQATRLASTAVTHLIEQVLGDQPQSSLLGLQHGKIRFTPISQYEELIEPEARRPREQTWMALRPIAAVMDRPEEFGESAG